MIDSNAGSPNIAQKTSRHVRRSVWSFAKKLLPKERKTLRFFFQTLNENRKYVAGGVFFSLASAVFDGSTFAILAVAMDSFLQTGASGANSNQIIGFFVDYLNSNFAATTIFVLLIGLAVLTQLLTAGLSFANSVTTAHLQANIETSLIGRVFRQFTEMSYAQFSRYKLGDLISYVEQVRQVGLFVHNANLLISTSLSVLVYIVLLLWLSWPLTLMAVVVLGSVSFVLKNIVLRVRQMSRREVTASVRVNEHINEYLQGMRLVRTFAQEEAVTKKVEQHLHESRSAKRQGLIWSGLVSPLFESVLIIAIALFLLASYLAVDLIGTQPLAQTAVFLVILYRLMPRISGFNNGLARATQHSAALQRIGEILRRDDKEYLSSGTLAFTGLQDGIVFENVTLHYDANERQVLQNLSLTIPRGRMVALVGESGAGKSSIISLLLRLYDPNSGRILVNGTDLRQFQLSSWQYHIGLVDQDPFLFNASVLDNIRFGHPDATREEVIQAAKVANAHGFIEELDAGYDTTIGDRGLRLSGGQRQRISIARAILRNPDLLIFDEATSDLDSQSEQLIQEAIQNLRKDRTVVVIAHRLSTVTMADSIIVLQKGQVAEQGTHAELLAQDKLYAQFWRIQSNAP